MEFRVWRLWNFLKSYWNNLGAPHLKLKAMESHHLETMNKICIWKQNHLGYTYNLLKASVRNKWTVFPLALYIHFNIWTYLLFGYTLYMDILTGHTFMKYALRHNFWIYSLQPYFCQTFALTISIDSDLKRLYGLEKGR